MYEQLLGMGCTAMQHDLCPPELSSIRGYQVITEICTITGRIDLASSQTTIKHLHTWRLCQKKGYLDLIP